MTTTKSRYRFRFRPLTGEFDGFDLEAGPFTPDEAQRFCDLEATKRATEPRAPWVGGLEEIHDALPSPFRLRGLLLIVGCITLGYLIGWFLVTVKL